MTRNSTVSFAELRRFLENLGYTATRTPAAWVLKHPAEGLLVFRLYGDQEGVDAGDLVSTRKFLDLRGILAGEDFDAFLQGASTSA